MDDNALYYGLPGSELVEQGLLDLNAGIESESSLVLLQASNRLRGLGILIPIQKPGDMSENRLYSLLSIKYGNDAHSRYNSLRRRIISFAECLEREQRTVTTI